jgi:hypothetical protein
MMYLPAHHLDVLPVRLAARLGFAVTAAAFLLAAAMPARATETDLTITQNVQFDFGRIVPGQTGTITIAAGSTCSRTASPASLVVASSSCSAAAFTVRDPDEKNTSNTEVYTVTLPTSVTLSSAGGGSMTLSNFTYSPALNLNGQLAYSGSCISAITGLSCPLYVGATLTINAAPSSAGSISGTYDITIHHPQ